MKSGTIVELIEDYEARPVSPIVEGRSVLKKGTRFRVFTLLGGVVEAFILGSPALYHLPLSIIKKVPRFSEAPQLIKPDGDGDGQEEAK